LQQNTEEFKTKINSVVQKYKTLNPKIQQINTYFKDLEDNEYFFIFLNATISKEQSFPLHNYLLALREGEDFEKITKEIDGLFSVLMDSYEMFAFDADTKNNIKIGESDKSKRVCRYCNKKNPEVSFKKVAHSISEALGNKKIITNDECDACNEKFGKGIENDLILYLNPYRVFFGIRGKNGIPKFKGKNFEIEKNEIEIIRLKRHRRKCPCCNKIFEIKPNFVSKYHKITNRLALRFFKEISKIKSIKLIAQENYVSSTTIQIYIR